MFKKGYIIFLKIKFHLLLILYRFRDKLILDYLQISSYSFPLLLKKEYLTGNRTMFNKKIEISGSNRITKYLKELCEHYLKHEFNFLGTGWYIVRMEIKEKRRDEMISKRCRSQNKKVASNIVDIISSYSIEYDFIDWQVDFSNRYSWDEKKLSKELNYKRGADIKIPWELGRCQHLPQMALLYYLLKDLNDVSSIEQNRRIVLEFKAQILDFIAFNPPEFGTQWFHSMDVGIRISNWLISYDILKQSGVLFDEEFEMIFFRSVYQHGHHIFNNLERYINKRANHYFADLIGLLFVSYYLPESRLTTKWLDFATLSYIEEFDFQFFNDGGNIEGSTAYHRMVSEFVLWGSLIIENLPRELLGKLRIKITKNLELKKYLLDGSKDNNYGFFFSEDFYKKLKSISHLLADVTKPDGTAWLIGDNDNGRLFKFTVEKELFSIETEKTHLFETPNFISTIASFSGIFGESFNLLSPYYLIETEIISAVNSVLGTHEILLTERNSAYDNLYIILDEIITANTNIANYEIPLRTELKNISTIEYADFGIFIYKSEDFFLGIRCGGFIKNNIVGHRHKDQLSLEIFCNNAHKVRDPGMPAYTSDPDIRDFYRSEKAHFIPDLLFTEKGILRKPFTLEPQELAECIMIDNNSFVGRLRITDKNFYRIVRILDSSIKISDYFILGIDYNSMAVNSYKSVQFSPSYGTISDQASINIKAV